MSFKIFVLSLFPISLFATTLEPSLITADRIRSTRDKTSNEVRVYTSEEIATSTDHTLAQFLTRESDITIAASGPAGSNASLFLRGTDSSHTLVILDGIIMNDPGNPNRQFDIGRLSLNNIETVEILKGSQGLAYGSNAIGGVIVITSKKAKSNAWAGESYLSAGSFRTVNGGMNAQKKFENNFLTYGIDVLNSDGFSAANDKKTIADRDGSRRITMDLGVRHEFSETLNVENKIRFNHTLTDLDKGGGDNNDDPNDTMREEEFYGKVDVNKTWAGGNADTKFSYDHTRHYRRNEELYDSKNPVARVTTAIGSTDHLSLNHIYLPFDKLIQNLNLDWLKEYDQSHHSNQNVSAFLYHQYEEDLWLLNFGLRVDHNEKFKYHETYKISSGVKSKAGLFKISYSTGFRAPSLNQLFDPLYGNLNLTPEKSQSIEISWERNWMKLNQSLSLFYTKLSNRFSYHPATFVNINSGEAEISGIEENISYQWHESVNQNISMTVLKTQDLKTGNKLARRPDYNFRHLLSYALTEGQSFEFESYFTGKRNDVDNLGNTVSLNHYSVHHLNYRIKVGPSNDYFVTVKNLLNEKYEEIYGFGNGGRAFTLGAHFAF